MASAQTGLAVAAVLISVYAIGPVSNAAIQVFVLAVRLSILIGVAIYLLQVQEDPGVRAAIDLAKTYIRAFFVATRTLLALADAFVDRV